MSYFLLTYQFWLEWNIYAFVKLPVSISSFYAHVSIIKPCGTQSTVIIEQWRQKISTGIVMKFFKLSFMISAWDFHEKHYPCLPITLVIFISDNSESDLKAPIEKNKKKTLPFEMSLFKKYIQNVCQGNISRCTLYRLSNQSTMMF